VRVHDGGPSFVLGRAGATSAPALSADRYVLDVDGDFSAAVPRMVDIEPSPGEEISLCAT